MWDGDVSEGAEVLRGGLGIARRPIGRPGLAVRVVRVVVDEERLRADRPLLQNRVHLRVEDEVDGVARFAAVVAGLAVLVELEAVPMLLGPARERVPLRPALGDLARTEG